MWEGKDHMTVRNWQQLVFPIYDPAFTIGCLTFGAVSVAARVIADRLCATRFTDRNMTSQHVGSTYRQCPEGFLYLDRRVILIFKCGTMKADDVAEFMFGPQC
jgi:hypothetical protein